MRGVNFSFARTPEFFEVFEALTVDVCDPSACDRRVQCPSANGEFESSIQSARVCSEGVGALVWRCGRIAARVNEHVRVLFFPLSQQALVKRVNVCKVMIEGTLGASKARAHAIDRQCGLALTT